MGSRQSSALTQLQAFLMIFGSFYNIKNMAYRGLKAELNDVVK